MKSQTLIRRYAQGLVGAIANEVEYGQVSAELKAVAELISDQPKISGTLSTRFLPMKKKMQLAEEIVASMGLQDKTGRFLLLLVENDRLSLLDSIRTLLPELWNDSRGVTTFEVSSVVPLADEQKSRLKATLETLEKRQVALNFIIDPDLVGGLSVRKQNIVFDVSVRGELEKLKETLIEG